MKKNEVSRVFGAAVCAALCLAGSLSGCALDSQSAEGGVEPGPTPATGSVEDVNPADLEAPIKAAPVIAREPIIVQMGETYTLREDEIFEAPQTRGGGEGEKACGLGRVMSGSALIWQGDFGDWATCVDQCPVGSLAYSIRLKSEPWQRGGDDTAVNGIALDCWKPINGTSIQYMGSVTSWTQKWGSWGSANTCPVNKPIIHAVIRSERSLGSGGDDVALTNLTAVCKDGAALVTPTIPAGTNWGEDRDNGYACPAGSAVCGIETRIERDQGSSGDDTALNGVKLWCCKI